MNVTFIMSVDLKKLLRVKHFISRQAALVGNGLKKLFVGSDDKEPIIGISEWFYFTGLAVLTAGVAEISVAAAWITCGTVMLLTYAASFYSYIRKQK